jgi:TPR repeat protein
MKKLILFVLLCISLTAFAQPKYSGDIRYIEDRSPSWIGIDATFNVSIFVDGTTAGPHFRHSLNGIKVNHLKIKGTFYSSSQLPANVINAIKENARIQVSFDLYDGDINIKKLDGASHISWDELLRLPASEHYKQSTTDAGVKLYNSGRLNIRNVKITSLSYTSSELQDFIDEKSNPVKAPAKSASNSANNSVTEVSVSMPDSKMTTPSADVSGESTETDNSDSEIDVPNTSGDDTSTNYTPTSYTPTPTKTEIYVQAAATVVGSLVDELNANYERKMALRAAESSANTKADLERKELKFNTVYMPLMEKANNGDENARMILYYANQAYGRYEMVNKMRNWLDEAAENGNQDAELGMAGIKSDPYTNGYDNYVEYLEKIAKKGNVDALMMIASYYDMSDKATPYPGGNDPIKALEYFIMAAEKGSPIAMYKLGMIYKYGRTPDTKNGNGFLKKWHVKYDIIPDEKVAFEWFNKSLIPDYVESVYSRASMDYDVGLNTSYFNSKTYLELADIYKKGKVVPKDKDKAVEFELLYRHYINKQKFIYY